MSRQAVAHQLLQLHLIGSARRGREAVLVKLEVDRSERCDLDRGAIE